MKSNNKEIMVEKAKEYFHGKEEYNCVQAVLKTLQQEYNISEEMIGEGKAYGGGRARDGVCGALYAMEMVDKDMYNKIEKDFEKEAGSIKCLDIKDMEKLSCRSCVGYAVERVIEEKNKTK